MKKLLYIFIFLTSSILVAQQKLTLKVELDYLVDYTVGPENSGITFTMGFDKSGRFLWSDFKMFQTILESSLNRSTGVPSFFKDGKTQFILDTKTLTVYVHLSNENNTMFMKMNIEEFFAAQIPKSENEPKEIMLLSEKTDEKITILDKVYKSYNVYPSTELNNALSVVFDKKFPVNNEKLFEGFISSVMNKVDNSTLKSIDLPKGVILHVKTKNEVLLKATNVQKTNRTITINNTLEIKE
ncbi:hypothetical protein [Kordia sp.]|uniref:hypothetical protein n=1 Tax=Kordia sp. TaxID=1965332 RepID=UPI003D6C3E8A